jgi:2-succinyl-5-enolpyruvyl-6-hydroxy-3-cyclohexene-1-carboxylate synthase
VVHLNMPFRKPLEPTVVEGDVTDVGLARENSSVTPMFSRSIPFPPAAQWDAFESVLKTYEKGLIICGPRSPGGDFTKAIALISQISGYPIVADPLAEVRFGVQTETTAVIGGYETFLNGTALEAPDVVIRSGKCRRRNG